MSDPNDSSVEMQSFGDDFNSHGAGGALVKVKDSRPGPGGTMICFSCENCIFEEGRVEKAGGKVVRSKFSIGEHGFISLAEDTEGNIIGFHSLK